MLGGAHEERTIDSVQSGQKVFIDPAEWSGDIKACGPHTLSAIIRDEIFVLDDEYAAAGQIRMSGQGRIAAPHAPSHGALYSGGFSPGESTHSVMWAAVLA